MRDASAGGERDREGQEQAATRRRGIYVMSGMVETHRSFVNTWECDDNAHMNVQFYFKRFDEASRFLAAMDGKGTSGPLPHTRHVRYHSELHAGGIARIRSAIVADGRFAGHAVHILDNIETGGIAATALEAPSGLSLAAHRVTESEVEQALPRGVAAGPSAPMPVSQVLSLGGLISNRSIVQPGQCDAAGELLAQNYVARLSDGAAHVWETAGVGIDRLRALNYGRVALEMKLTHHRPVRAGDALLLHSRGMPSRGKAMGLHHEMIRLADGTPVLTAEVVAVILDLATRRSVLPPGLEGV
jgi:acyl-CoA thioester hydrolase